MKPALATIYGGILLAGCGGDQSILGSQSPGAAQVESLWWVGMIGTGILALVVFGGLWHSVRRALHRGGDMASAGVAGAGDPGPAGSEDPEAPAAGLDFSRREDRFILLAGAAGPALFLVAFLAFSVRTGAEVALPPGEAELTIEVVGHKFWWEIHYPEHGFSTANELHIPADRIVEVLVTSADVIHSFWVPQLSPGKIDMVPGRTNAIWMLAPEPGRFRGQCTEFCGVQHALMSMAVTAHEPEAFDAWLEARAAPRVPPTDPQTQEGVAVFFEAGCAACHSIDGVRPRDPEGMAGPDLTDVASRETLAALTIPNDRAHLSAWILNPHAFKSGARMPPTPLDGRRLDALVTYLETLE